jgi:HlyD family secretion protein
MAVTGARTEDIRQAESMDRQAVAGFELAQSDHRRVKQLYESGAATKKMMDDAETRLTVSDAQKEASKDVLKKIRKYTRPEELAMARARVDAAKAMLASLEKKISDCTVPSPVGGMVLARVFEPGEMVSPASTIVVVSDLKKLRAVVYLPEADVFRIKYGEKVKVTTDGFAGRAFDGAVSFISQKAEFTPRNVQTKDERVKLMFEVKIAVENPDLVLKPGLPIDVTFSEATTAGH